MEVRFVPILHRSHAQSDVENISVDGKSADVPTPRLPQLLNTTPAPLDQTRTDLVMGARAATRHGGTREREGPTLARESRVNHAEQRVSHDSRVNHAQPRRDSRCAREVTATLSHESVAPTAGV